VSSGNYAGRAGFNNTEKPNTEPACDSLPEPRGPGVFFAGLCVACGRATTERDDNGRPRHRLRSELERLMQEPPQPKLGEAAHELERCELARQGAERAAAEKARQDRLSALQAIRDEIGQAADPADAIEAATRIVAAVADLITAAGPARTALVTKWINQVRALGVQPLTAFDSPSPDDGGIAWRPEGFGGDRHIVMDGRSIAPVPLPQLIGGLVAEGCRRAGVSSGPASATGARCSPGTAARAR